MTPASAVPEDSRPRTAALQQWVGMGDLVWHVPYFRKLAETSHDGKLTVIASPTAHARELLGHEPWVHEVIDFDRHPRRQEQRKGRHRGVMGLIRMGAELSSHRFDRIVLFTNHSNRALVALRAGIPCRVGYGTSWLQRRMLTRTPWIERYKGPAVTAYKDVTAFSIAQGWCDSPIVPRLQVRPDALARMRDRLATLRRPLVALAIGASEAYKQWGDINFAGLADLLADAGCGVLLLGGSAETELSRSILLKMAARHTRSAMAITDAKVSDTVAAMAVAQACVGNDTGASNIAAAVGTPTWVVLGPRPPLEHDPATLHLVRAPRLDDIRPGEVFAGLGDLLRLRTASEALAGQAP